MAVAGLQLAQDVSLERNRMKHEDDEFGAHVQASDRSTIA